MNNDMYQLVKQELAKGTPLEQIMDTVKSMADCATNELRGKISKDMTSEQILHAAKFAILNPKNEVDKTSLITFIGAYMVQNGVNADAIAKTYADYRESIEKILDSDVKTFHQIAAVSEKVKNSASDKELLHEAMKAVTDNFKGLFGSEPNFWQL